MYVLCNGTCLVSVPDMRFVPNSQTVNVEFAPAMNDFFVEIQVIFGPV